MAAKALIPVEAFPRIDRFRGHGPLLQFEAHPHASSPVTPHLLVDISAHGFGHLAMTAPVVEAVARLVPRLQITVRCTIPEAKVREMVGVAFRYLPRAFDIGMAMRDALHIDVPASLAHYTTLHGDWDTRVAAAADELASLNPTVLLGNIPYLSIAAAAHAGIPAVAFCCLHWGEIFAHYCGREPGAAAIGAQIRDAYASAACFLRATPGIPMPGLNNLVDVGPVAREAASRRPDILASLGRPASTRLALLSLGGVPFPLDVSAFRGRCRSARWRFPIWMCSHRSTPWWRNSATGRWRRRASTAGRSCMCPGMAGLKSRTSRVGLPDTADARRWRRPILSAGVLSRPWIGCARHPRPRRRVRPGWRTWRGGWWRCWRLGGFLPSPRPSPPRAGVARIRQALTVRRHCQRPASSPSDGAREPSPFRGQRCIHRPCRRGPCPRKQSMQGNASTGTGAFAAMGRSYNSWRIHLPCRRGPSPRKRWMQGSASTGIDAFAGMAGEGSRFIPSPQPSARVTGRGSTAGPRGR